MRRPVPGKARVHELAKEFGVDSKTVLAKLKEQGEFVKSASSTVEAPVARRLREALGGGNGAAAPAAKKAAPAAKPAPPAPAASAPAAPARPAAPTPGPRPAAPAPQAPAASAPVQQPAAPRPAAPRPAAPGGT